MAHVAARLQDSKDSPAFAALLDSILGGPHAAFEGAVVAGTVVGVDKEFALIDVGLKSEGRIALTEFGRTDTEVRIGDCIDVYVERLEDKNGEAVLSREKARREEAWQEMERNCENRVQVMGTIFNKIKGGFMVDLGGAVAFLPGSQVDVRPLRDIGPLMGEPQPFHILKMDRSRGNIVVSRRTVLEETRQGARDDVLDQIREGQIIKGVVKNLTDYGAFVDLGGVDGLLHVTDMSWGRIAHPSDMLCVGQTIEVQIIRYNQGTQRISLGIKQLGSDPWDRVQTQYPVGTRIVGRVTNVTEYGAFVEVEPGVEGLVHVSEMSWTKKSLAPGKLLAASQEVEVMVLEIDMDKRRISLGIKQCQENPWEAFVATHTVGDEIEGPIQNITEFGLFIGLGQDRDGMVHLSDITWDDASEAVLAAFEKGQIVRAKILDMDASKERIALGIKQISGGVASTPATATTDKDKDHTMGVSLVKGSIVTCTVSAITDGGVEVTVGEDGLKGFIKRIELSRDRSEQHGSRFAVGEKIDAKITAIDKKRGEIALSIKAREIDEDKKAMEAFGSTESGASLGDILGAALRDKDKKRDKSKK